MFRWSADFARSTVSVGKWGSTSRWYTSMYKVGIPASAFLPASLPRTYDSGSAHACCPRDMTIENAAEPSVYIVLLNWNSADYTVAAVDSILQLEYSNWEVLIVDNGSTDDSTSKLRRVISDRIHLFELPENLGYTGGCNIGMRRALETGAEYVWLLNNDGIVFRDTLSRLVRVAMSDPQVGLVTPMIASMEATSHMTYAGGVIYVEARRYDETNDPKEAEELEERYPGKGLVIGTAMLIRTSLIRKIGFLDERFFAYYEDIDYSARSIAAGYRNVVDRSSVIQHLEKNRQITPLEMKPHYWYYMARNESRFWRKHVGLLRSLRPTAGAFLRFAKNLNACKSKPRSTDAILAGLWHGWWDRGGPYEPTYRMPGPIAFLVWFLASRPRFQATEPQTRRIPAQPLPADWPGHHCS